MFGKTVSPTKIRSDQTGFTLIEMMVVLAIIGVASAIAVPNFLMMYARHELYQTTTELYNRLVFARSAAISRNAVMVATPSNLPGGGGQVLFTNPLGVETIPQKVSFVLPLPAAPIGFTPRGLSTAPLAIQTIQLQSIRDPNLIYTISLAPSGRVTWCPMQVTPCV